MCKTKFTSFFFRQNPCGCLFSIAVKQIFDDATCQNFHRFRIIVDWSITTFQVARREIHKGKVLLSHSCIRIIILFLSVHNTNFHCAVQFATKLHLRYDYLISSIRNCKNSNPFIAPVSTQLNELLKGIYKNAIEYLEEC